MELQTAIEILEYYQGWRLGKREYMIHEPKKLTEAIDIVLSYVKENRLGAVSGRREQLSCPRCRHTGIDTDKNGLSYCRSCAYYWRGP